MANDDWDVPANWYDAEAEIFAGIVGDNATMANDEMLQFLLDQAWFEGADLHGKDLRDARDLLEDYLYDEYDIDFDAVFDWEAWDRWYATA